MQKRNTLIQEAVCYGYAPSSNWICPGCGVVLGPIQSARRHIKKPCVCFEEVINRRKVSMSNAKNRATQMMLELLQSNVTTPAPQYALVDLNSLYSLTEKLTCPWCHNKIRVQRVSKNQLVFTLRVYCV